MHKAEESNKKWIGAAVQGLHDEDATGNNPLETPQLPASKFLGLFNLSVNCMTIGCVTPLCLFFLLG